MKFLVYVISPVAVFALLLVGCGAKEQIARKEIALAGGMFEAAEIIGAESHAPVEMAKVRYELKKAESLINREPLNGRLSFNISQRADDIRMSAESAQLAKSETEQILLGVGKEWFDRLPGNETVLGFSTEEMARLQTAEECQQSLDMTKADLLTCQEQARVAAAEVEGVGRSAFYSALNAEFANDLVGWGAEIDRETAALRFIGSATAFESNSTLVNQPMQKVLEDFFPRLLKLVSRPEFRLQVEEIRVEGYASKGHLSASDDNDRYYRNLLLSQGRSSNVVHFLLQQPSLQNEWLREHLVAAGMSDKQPVINVAGQEDPQRSRRIEVKVIMTDTSGPTLVRKNEHKERDASLANGVSNCCS